MKYFFQNYQLIVIRRIKLIGGCALGVYKVNINIINFKNPRETNLFNSGNYN